MQEVKKQKSKLNKGFSLVELIVVIAIMAVLVGVIATQFVKYVGKSTDTADKTNVDSLQSAANAVLADPDLGPITAGTYIISGNGELSQDNVSGAPGKFKSLLETSLGTDPSGNPKYPKATDTNKKFTITVTGNASEGYSATVKLD